MIINCTLKRANPSEVNYTWYLCDAAKCDGNNSAHWKLKSKMYSLKIDTQMKTEMKYRCVARNVVGKDESSTITVQMSRKVNNTSAYDAPEESPKTFIYVLVPTVIITVIILFATCFVLYKRKKIYGGVYLFSYPPLPDYMKNLDINENIQEQLQRLPFIPEWEFPRERISFRKYNKSPVYKVAWTSFGRVFGKLCQKYFFCTCLASLTTHNTWRWPALKLPELTVDLIYTLLIKKSKWTKVKPLDQKHIELCRKYFVKTVDNLLDNATKLLHRFI